MKADQNSNLPSFWGQEQAKCAPNVPKSLQKHVPLGNKEKGGSRNWLSPSVLWYALQDSNLEPSD